MAERPSWDAYFMQMARQVASRASCPRASVGAVLVNAENRVLATGYNGAPSGDPDCLTVGCDMADGHCQRALHAEVNVIAHCARAGVSVHGARIYVTGSGGRGVCRECAKVLTAAGVRVAEVED